MSIDPLIEQLKQLDNRQSATQQSLVIDDLVQRVVRTANRRRSQRKSRVVVGAVAWVGAMAVRVLWLRPEHEEPKIGDAIDNVARDVEPVPVRADEPAGMIKPAETQRQTQLSQRGTGQVSQQQSSQPQSDNVELLTLVNNSFDNDREAELERWREEHARLKRRLEELETLILREKLSRELNADDVTKDIFF